MLFRQNNYCWWNENTYRLSNPMVQNFCREDELPLFDQAGAPEEVEALPLPPAPPLILVPSRENTLGRSMLPSPLLSLPLPALLFSFLPSRLLLPRSPPFLLLPLPDLDDIASTWNWTYYEIARMIQAFNPRLFFSWN